MSKIISLIFFFTIFFFFQPLVAQPEEINGTEIFNEGNAFYAQKKYTEASEKYFTLLANGLESAEIYYNIGNCFFHRQNWGKAILNYERALILAPNDKNILNNLQIANDKTVDEIEKIPTFFLTRWWRNIYQLTHSGIWSILGILLLWGGIGGLVMWLLGKERKQRKQGFLAGTVAILLSLFVFALAYSSYQMQKNSGSAIIMSKETSLKTLPDEISTEILPLHEGTKVEITEKITSWYKVRLENGEVGWIIESALEEI